LTDNIGIITVAGHRLTYNAILHEQVDLLGTGLSSRPPFRAKNTEQAESFFVESLEAWREAVGLEEFILMGHSMGGYLAALYAIQYPNRVRHLVMVCPAGVGKRPDTWEPPESVRSPWTWKGQLYRLAVNIWNAGITPGLIIRSMGPFGPSLVEKYTRNRFKTGHHLSEEEIEAFHKYMYGILAAKGSGEYALKHILEPFAFPRQPLEHRMDSITFPITFIYGDQDWMDPKAAKRLLNRVRDARQRKLVESDLKVLTTVSAGHYPFLDQPGAFLMNILDTCGCYLSHEARKKIERIAQEYPVLSLPAMDTEEQLRKEFAKDPATAEVHIASDL